MGDDQRSVTVTERGGRRRDAKALPSTRNSAPLAGNGEVGGVVQVTGEGAWSRQLNTSQLARVGATLSVSAHSNLKIASGGTGGSSLVAVRGTTSAGHFMANFSGAHADAGFPTSLAQLEDAIRRQQASMRAQTASVSRPDNEDTTRDETAHQKTDSRAKAKPWTNPLTWSPWRKLSQS